MTLGKYVKPLKRCANTDDNNMQPCCLHIFLSGFIFVEQSILHIISEASYLREGEREGDIGRERERAVYTVTDTA